MGPRTRFDKEPKGKTKLGIPIQEDYAYVRYIHRKDIPEPYRVAFLGETNYNGWSGVHLRDWLAWAKARGIDATDDT